MKILLIVAWLYAGEAVHTQQIGYGTMERCESSAAKLRRDVEAQRGNRAFSIVTVCIEAY